MKPLHSKEWPAWCLASPEFRYIPANRTDVAKTFQRERERLEEERQIKQEQEHERANNT